MRGCTEFCSSANAASSKEPHVTRNTLKDPSFLSRVQYHAFSGEKLAGNPQEYRCEV